MESSLWKNSKIYRLVCSDGKFYIGSTVLSLEKRFAQHKRNSQEGKSKVYRHIREIGGPENVKIELVADNLGVSTRDELLKVEDNYIREGIKNGKKLCLNRNHPRATDGERVQREALQKKMWLFLRKHPSDKPLRERIVEYYRTHKIKYYTDKPKPTDLYSCECSLDIPYRDLKRHRLSQKHKTELDRWLILKEILFNAWKT